MGSMKAKETSVEQPVCMNSVHHSIARAAYSPCNKHVERKELSSTIPVSPQNIFFFKSSFKSIQAQISPLSP